MNICLHDFTHLRPAYEASQERTLDWIAEAHTRAESNIAGWAPDSKERMQFFEEIKQRLYRVGSGKQKIRKRGIHIKDLHMDDWGKMPIYPVEKHPQGKGFSARSSFYDEAASDAFDHFYAKKKSGPAHLIHVTCTGYVAPSPAQKLVSRKKWGNKTIVTHAYHMGCYAAIPAIRMGAGFLHTLPSPIQKSADIVHTELCSLHMNPLRHSTEQLVVQSLFADGFIKYSASVEEKLKKQLSYFRVLALHEETLPDSLNSMTWRCEDWGFGMSIAKEVPVLISRNLPGFLKRMFQTTTFSLEKQLKKCLFAVHPGGPKILHQVEKLLQLPQERMSYSHDVLRHFGNMSSATLPHIWEKMLKDGSVQDKILIVSLAFGPGLSISGALFEKRG